MDLISLIIVLVVVGELLWAVNTLVPIDGKIKMIINAIVIIVVLLWLLSLFSGYLPHFAVGKK